MIQAAFVFVYLAVVLYVGVFAFRRSRGGDAEEFFLANRSLGSFVFLMSLFGTNMTAFAILGSSGHAFANGIVTYGLMASSSGLVIPLTIFLCGTRLWALGKRHGFMTPVQLFRDRWEMSHIGTVIMAVQSALLIPYIVIGVMGGGTTLEAVSGGLVPYWLGGAIVALVVMGYVFFGGMRGTAWVNTLQTVLFLVFGVVAVAVIGAGMGGFRRAAEAMLASPQAPLLTRERVSPLYFFSYTFIPLSAMAFPHIAIFCLTAKKMAQFKKTVIFYPVCIMAIWLPCVFLGIMANRAGDVPSIRAKLEARRTLASPAASALPPAQRADLRETARGDDVLIRLLDHYAPMWLAGLLGAGIMAAVMASDSQILALSTMFTEDVFKHYGGRERFGGAVEVATGRAFVVGMTLLAWLIAMASPTAIFDLAIQYALSGYAALSPLLIAALFWRRSTRWGALAVAVWVALAVTGVAVFQELVAAPPPGATKALWTIGGTQVLARTPTGTSVLGFLPVMPMTLISAVLMIVVSLLTPPPSPATLDRYFRRA
ncbi:MAG TPA: sodium:solute symporter family protein [Vicinamibacteria bacterium]|nr:sodium:solute symporter family protein [Vicinamibacteria bacterium]